jgi:hypothetical protein
MEDHVHKEQRFYRMDKEHHARSRGIGDTNGK